MGRENASGSLDLKRPAVLKFFGMIVIAVSFFHLLQLIQVGIRWQVLSSLPLNIPPLILALEGLLWFLSGMVLSYGLWKTKSWTRSAGKILSGVYFLSNWGIKIWSTPWDELVQRLPADLLITLIGLGLVFLALDHPASKLTFKEKH